MKPTQNYFPFFNVRSLFKTDCMKNTREVVVVNSRWQYLVKCCWAKQLQHTTTPAEGSDQQTKPGSTQTWKSTHWYYRVLGKLYTFWASVL